jgi:hypothetical protein
MLSKRIGIRGNGGKLNRMNRVEDIAKMLGGVKQFYSLPPGVEPTRIVAGLFNPPPPPTRD